MTSSGLFCPKTQGFLPKNSIYRKICSPCLPENVSKKKPALGLSDFTKITQKPEFDFDILMTTIEEQILQKKFGQARFQPSGYQNNMGKEF